VFHIRKLISRFDFSVEACESFLVIAVCLSKEFTNDELGRIVNNLIPMIKLARSNFQTHPDPKPNNYI